MKREILTKLYHQAVEECNDNTAWLFEEKFAKVVIQECIGIIYDDIEPHYNLIQRIEGHFGI